MSDCRNVKCTADVTTSSETVIFLFHKAILVLLLYYSHNLGVGVPYVSVRSFNKLYDVQAETIRQGIYGISLISMTAGWSFKAIIRM